MSINSPDPPCLIDLVARATMESTKVVIFTIVLVISGVGGTSVYDSRCLKELSMPTRMSMSTSWLLTTSLAPWQYQCHDQGQDCALRHHASKMMLTKRRTPIPERTTHAGESAWGRTIGSQTIGAWSIETNVTNTLTKCSRKCVENFHSSVWPIC